MNMPKLISGDLFKALVNLLKCVLITIIILNCVLLFLSWWQIVHLVDDIEPIFHITLLPIVGLGVIKFLKEFFLFMDGD